jgi:hypothetical protein
VTYSRRFEEFDACIRAGLDIERWQKGEYDRDLMARVVAWHRLSGMIEAHVEDARGRELERQSRRRK